MSGWCIPPPRRKHEPDDGDNDDDAGDGGTRDEDDSGEQQVFPSRKRTATATEICLNVTESLDELAKSQARRTDHSTILITTLKGSHLDLPKTSQH